MTISTLYDKARFTVGKVMLFLKFIFFPSWITKQNDIDHAEYVRVDFKSNDLPLVISFAGLGGQFNFLRSLDGFAANVIYIKDLKHHWYLTGIPGAGNTVPEITEFLKGKATEFRATRVITLGTSAGGFAALLFGAQIGATSIIAISPQTFMNKWNCIRYLDYRWLDRVVEVYRANDDNRQFLDIKSLVSEYQGDVTLIYDVTHRLDNLHAGRISGNHIVRVEEKSGGHNVARTMKNEGRLDQLLKETIA